MRYSLISIIKPNEPLAKTQFHLYFNKTTIKVKKHIFIY